MDFLSWIHHLEKPDTPIGVLTILTFDPFFVHFCRHRPSKMNWKMRTMNLPPLKFWKMRSKMSKKWNSTFFGTQQPWTPHLGQPLLYLIISPMPSVSLKSSLSLYWLVFSPLKKKILNFSACSVVWMVNRMRWLPYAATTKRTDNAKTPFSNLKNWRRKMDEKWKHIKNRHAVHFWKMGVFRLFFISLTKQVGPGKLTPFLSAKIHKNGPQICYLAGLKSAISIGQGSAYDAPKRKVSENVLQLPKIQKRPPYRGNWVVINLGSCFI